MTMASWNVGAYQKQTPALDVTCRKKERDRDRSHPYKVIEITPPPKNLGIRCFPPWILGKCNAVENYHAVLWVHCTWCLPNSSQREGCHYSTNGGSPKGIGEIRNLQCGESVTIEGQAYTISSVTHRYQLRRGKYEPSEKRLDVLSTGRYILNLYLENLLEQS
ncbi:hypothetical protein NC653_038033 [Populus alba x Populus x berolinensis]|uniref:Uncharacterized protein n=1 Tax=Populus alba x Populus x berolinensis TaxID=444605 RepID=A0AAD6PUB9_9ROSI|nr:hypothetical protein NC653_038033 [Populus alba x Populus x berolinensis]